MQLMGNVLPKDDQILESPERLFSEGRWKGVYKRQSQHIVVAYSA